ncbi:Rhodanese-like domain-containing protein [Phaeosphaeriaceae sp. PMI808]|nr:Rhodanese-like domain-containing protein [Phaeosphaeriaceae sp. PMI808]
MLASTLRCRLRPLSSFSISLYKPIAAIGGRRTMATNYTLDSYMVTPTELNSVLQKNVHSRLSTAPRVVPLCASWFLPNDGRNGYNTFLKQRIPHARFFDLDAVVDAHSPYPHMLPTPRTFAESMQRMGIRREDSVVVYDSKELGLFSAPRVALTLRIFGHENVHVLNNFKKWVEEGYPTEAGEGREPQHVEYPIPEIDESKVVGFDELKGIAKDLKKEGSEEVQVLDARSRGRWEGKDPEPREGIPSGHIPYSISIPINTLLDPDDKTLLSPPELRYIFESKGVDPTKPIISTCGTGVTAAVIDAALTEAGYPSEQRRLYDGSWTEWAQRVKPGDGLIRKLDNRGVNPSS